MPWGACDYPSMSDIQITGPFPPDEIKCGCCEALFPAHNEPRGEYVQSGDDEKRAAWVCTFCARSIERWRQARDREGIEEMHRASCPECGNDDEDPTKPPPTMKLVT